MFEVLVASHTESKGQYKQGHRSGSVQQHALDEPLRPAPFSSEPWSEETRQVTGTIRLKTRLLYLSTALRQHRVALEEVDDGIWSLYFCNVLLGRIDERRP